MQDNFESCEEKCGKTVQTTINHQHKMLTSMWKIFSLVEDRKRIGPKTEPWERPFETSKYKEKHHCVILMLILEN